MSSRISASNVSASNGMPQQSVDTMDAMGLILRKATLADLEQLDELEFDCFEQDAFNRRRWRYLLDSRSVITLVLEDRAEAHVAGQQLLGYGMLLTRCNSRQARLYSLAVHPSIARQGQARRLLMALEARAEAGGLRAMVLEVRADNRPAIGLYRRMGYQARRWIDDYYSDGCAALRMLKSLG